MISLSSFSSGNPVWRIVKILALTFALGACASIQQRTPVWLLPGHEAPPRSLSKEGPAPPPIPPSNQVPPAAQIESTAPVLPESARTSVTDLDSKPVKVALLLPLSGANAAVGEALLEAAQLALFDAGQDRFTLLVRDTEGQPETAATVTDEVIQAGAELILGPLFATEVQAIAPLARDHQIPVIAFSTDRTVAAPSVYLMGFTPEEQVVAVIRYAVRTGYSRFGALTPETAYGRAVEAALRTTVAKLGASMSKTATYPAETADFTQLARRFADYDRRKAALTTERQSLAEKDDDASRQALSRLQHHDSFGETAFDALFLPDGGARLRALAPVLAYFDIDPAKVKFLGTGQWDQPGLGNEPSLVGGWYAAAPPDAVEAFRTRYEQVYGRKPLRIASLGYDATALAALLSVAPKDRRFSPAAIGDRRGFAGFDGLFRFGDDGIVERGLAILEVQRNGVKVIRAAPENFEQVGE